MYFIDFIKSLAKKHRIPVIIYLVLNVVIITYIFNFFTESGAQGEFDWRAIPAALAVYVISIIISLSPIGEWILRLQLGCKKIKRADYQDYLNPIFKEVYARAKQMHPSLPDNIELFMNNDKVPNAFATGRRTICLTKGMLKASTAEELKGVLAHEFAHIANHDTDLILIVTVGNTIITALILFIRILFRILRIAGVFSNIFGSREGNLSIIIGVVGDLVIAIMMWLWTKFGQYLVLATSRSQEYYADEFSFKLGYSVGLCSFLSRFAGGKTKGVFAVLSSSHPDTDDRIARLQQLGSTFREI